MEHAAPEIKGEARASLQSTIRKMEKGLAQMTEKGANTTLIAKRLKASHIALAVLECVWDGTPHPYTGEELAEARLVLAGLIPSIEAVYAKSKEGSPQRTLLKRRLQALELAIQAIKLIQNS